MSITVNTHETFNMGSKNAVLVDLTMDSSYSYGGEALDADSLVGIRADMALIEPQKGYAFTYDRVNKKIRIFAESPPIVYEEQQTIAANSITLNYPAAYIMNISAASDPYKLTTTGATLASGECKPSALFTLGNRPTITFEAGASGVVYVTYITQAWKEVWDNLVQEEVRAVASNTCNLLNQAVAIQAINATGTQSPNSCLMLDKDDTVATLECVVDMTSTNKALTFFATDAVTTCTVTYIKKPASGFLANRFIAEESLTAAANVCTTKYPILIWGYSGQIPENGAATERFISLAGTAGADEAILDLLYHTTKITGESITTGTGMYVYGRYVEIPTIPLEVPNGTDLSTISGIKALFIGI